MNARTNPIAATGEERWEALVAGHRDALHEILTLAARYPESGALDGCRSWAERTLRQLLGEARKPRLDQPFGSIGTWGENGKGPAIRSQLHSAQTFAELAERRARRAA